MTGVEMFWEILTGLAAVVAVVGLITVVVTKISNKLKLPTPFGVMYLEKSIL